MRVLAHDLARAVNTSGHLSTLERTQQADYMLHPDKVLSYADLEAGEEVWGPKVQGFLEAWEDKRRGVVERLERGNAERRQKGGGEGEGKLRYVSTPEGRERRESPRRWRRNSSSAEE